MNGISLCSGVGGLELGLKIALGDHYRTVGYCEREAFAAAALVARMEDEGLDRAPVWDALESFPCELYRGKVDIVSAGLPCQPFSVAGRRGGDRDERHIWKAFFRIVDEVQPRAVFIENVPGILSTRTLGHRRDISDHIEALESAIDGEEDARSRWYAECHLERLHRRLLREYGIPMALFVLCALEERGYRPEAGIFGAADVGASQRRDRWFCLAWAGELVVRPWADGWGDMGTAATNTHRRGQATLRDAAACDSATVGGTPSPRHPPGEPQAGGALRDGARRQEPDRRCDEVASPRDGQLPVEGRGPEAREGAGSAGAILADAGGAELAVGRDGGGLREREAVAGSGEPVADPERGGWREAERDDDARQPDPTGSLPLFPPGPSDPAWGDILYRDGRFDLLPAITEEEAEAIASVRRVADELASRLDRHLRDHAKSTGRTKERVLLLWETIAKKAHERKARRLWRLHSQKVLRQIMYGWGEDEECAHQGCLQEADQALQEDLLREMRHLAEVTDSPQGQRLVEQRLGQLGNLVLDVPHERSLGGWGYTAASRLDRLRACGNGVVPLQAAAAFVDLVRRALT